MKNDKMKTQQELKMKYVYCDNWHGEMHYFDTLDEAESHARKYNMGSVWICHQGDIVSIVQGQRYFA